MELNRAFWRAFHSLGNPLSLLAVALLFFNDHYLRHNHPSWLTGKLGDFTWLIFAPMIAALVFAWILPRRLPDHEKWVGWLSFGFIGAWFALAKTTPLIHDWTTRAVEAINGWEGTLRIDPTDLLTLPALLIGWWVWKGAQNTPVNLRPLAHVALGLGIVATLASDDSYQDSGVLRICHFQDRLIAQTITPYQFSTYYAGGQFYTSEDGGLNWIPWKVELTAEQFESLSGVCSNRELALIDPTNEQIQYRWTPGQVIERSTDGGASWREDYLLKELQQEARAAIHYAKSENSYRIVEYTPGPVSAYFDPQSENLIFAMGWDGVLVRLSKGKYVWSAVGPDYRLENLRTFDYLTEILFFELWLMGALGFLIVTTSTAYIRRATIRFRWILLMIGWAGWLILSVSLLPQHPYGDYFYNSDYITVGLFALPLLVLIGLPLSAGAVWDIAANFRRVWRSIAFCAVGTAALYILPLLAWLLGSISLYETASFFANILATSGVIASAVFLAGQLEAVIVPEKKKKRPPQNRNIDPQ